MVDSVDIIDMLDSIDIVYGIDIQYCSSAMLHLLTRVDLLAIV